MKVGDIVLRQTAIAGSAALLLAFASPARAQRPAAIPEDQQQRYQIQNFVAVLVSAVRNGGDAFARQQAGAIPPGVQLTSTDPQVKPLVPPHGGDLLFYVRVPAIRIAISQLLIDDMARLARRPDQPMIGVARPGPQTGAQGLAQADPMTNSPVVDDGGCGSRVKPSRGYPTPDYEYAVAVCDALMDAMLDNSSALPIKENDWLTVAADNAEPDPLSVLNSTSGLTTYLSIKGSDLIAYRQGKISKDEARKLVELKHW